MYMLWGDTTYVHFLEYYKMLRQKMRFLETSIADLFDSGWRDSALCQCLIVRFHFHTRGPSPCPRGGARHLRMAQRYARRPTTPPQARRRAEEQYEIVSSSPAAGGPPTDPAPSWMGLPSLVPPRGWFGLEARVSPSLLEGLTEVRGRVLTTISAERPPPELSPPPGGSGWARGRCRPREGRG